MSRTSSILICKSKSQEPPFNRCICHANTICRHHLTKTICFLKPRLLIIVVLLMGHKVSLQEAKFHILLQMGGVFLQDSLKRLQMLITKFKCKGIILKFVHLKATYSQQRILFKEKYLRLNTATLSKLSHNSIQEARINRDRTQELMKRLKIIKISFNTQVIMVVRTE